MSGSAGKVGADAHELGAALQRAARTVVDVAPEAHRAFARIAEDADTAQRVVQYHRDLVALTARSPSGATVLDAGCGFGVSALALALLGAARVHAVEIGELQVAAMQRYLGALGELGTRIVPRGASVTDLPYEDAAFDLVLSNETYGVIHDLPSFLDEVARVLQHGGAVVLAEGDNELNPWLARRRRKRWTAYELGPAGAYVEGHRIEIPYVERRAAIARRVLPDAADSIVRAVAEGTFAMLEDEIVAACERWRTSGELPTSRFEPGLAPVDPAGMRVEAAVDPRWLRDELESRGLAARVIGYWGGAQGSGVVRAANRLLSALGPLALRTAPAVRVVARKHG